MRLDAKSKVVHDFYFQWDVTKGINERILDSRVMLYFGGCPSGQETPRQLSEEEKFCSNY